MGHSNKKILPRRGIEDSVRTGRSPLTGRCRLARTPSRRRPRRGPRNTRSRASGADPGIGGVWGRVLSSGGGGSPPPGGGKKHRPPPPPPVGGGAAEHNSSAQPR